MKIKNENFVLLDGPCAVESKTQIEEIAFQLKECRVDILRGEHLNQEQATILPKDWKQME